jgi:hypothetical protein
MKTSEQESDSAQKPSCLRDMNSKDKGKKRSQEQDEYRKSRIERLHLSINSLI